MSWSHVCDGNGRIEIFVSRWYNKYGNLEKHICIDGFQPYEPVDVEICGEDDERLATKPYHNER